VTNAKCVCLSRLYELCCIFELHLCIICFAFFSLALHRLGSSCVVYPSRLASPCMLCIALHCLALPCIALHRLASLRIALKRIVSPCIALNLNYPTSRSHTISHTHSNNQNTHRIINVPRDFIFCALHGVDEDEHHQTPVFACAHHGDVRVKH
jgi:hypothetical protein